MTGSAVFIYVALIILAAITLVVLILKTSAKNRQLSPLAGLSFVILLAGIIFGDEQWYGYGLMAVGISLALLAISRINKLKRKR